MSNKRAAISAPMLSEAELIARMVEATSGEPRPEDMTAEYAVARMLDEQQRQFFGAAARAAMAYLIEQTDAVTVITEKAKRHAVVAGEVFRLH